MDLNPIKKTVFLLIIIIIILSTVGCSKPIRLLALAGSRPDVEELKNAGDIEGLIKILGWIEGEDAQEALIEIGAPAVEPLIDALGKRNDEVAGAAAYTLGQIGDVRAIEPLIFGLDDVGKEAAFALAQFGGPRVIEALIDKIRRIPDELPWGWKDREFDYASPYIGALAQIGIPAVDALNEVINEQNDDFLKQAAEIALQWMLGKHISPVCDGQAIIAETYDSDYQRIHTLGMIKTDGYYNENDVVLVLPQSWIVTGDPRSVELVLCYEIESIKIETCRYTDGTSNSRYQRIYYFWLHSAATGEIIDFIEIKGGYPPPCPQTKKISSNWTPFIGSEFSTDDLLDWLTQYVEPTP